MEALPHRAAEDHVGRLIFGRFAGREHGIGAQMRMFRELGVPATFYLELGACALWGVEPLREAGRAILDEGFDLQLHLHAEKLVRAMKWPWDEKLGPPDLAALDVQLARQSLQYAVDRYGEIVGAPPLAFRAGAFRFNPHTVEIGAELGIRAFSNYRADQRSNNAYDFEGSGAMRPFRWANGAYEFPITISPEPLSARSAEECWRRILHHVRVNRTWVVTIVIHSWSFLQRDANGHQVYVDEVLSNALRRIIEIAPRGTRFASMSEVIEHADEHIELFDFVKKSV